MPGLQSKAERKVLTFFSDMRNEQPGVLDLEGPEIIDIAKNITTLQKRELIPRLLGVEVYVFGAGDHSGRKHPQYFTSLKAFWVEYVRRSGGNLRLFSTTRDMEAIRKITEPRRVP